MVLRDEHHLAWVLSRMVEIFRPFLEDDAYSIDRSELRRVMYWFEIDKFDCEIANQRLADHREGKPYFQYILGV